MMPFFICMNKILNIRLKNENYAIIDFESGAPLTVPKMLVYEMGLRKGDEVTAETIASLQKENELFGCEHKALDYLSRRLHSALELKRKLLQKGFPKETIEEVIVKMKSLNYLNDKKFAELLVSESLNLRHEGAQKIRGRLMEKGISKELIQEVLSGNELDSLEDQNIKMVADKKLFSLEKRFTDKREVNRKLTTFLVSRGFSFQLIKNYLRNIEQESDLDGDLTD